ncbi:outer membrane protein assembly factor BamC [Chitinimonas arctica]|uniref:Outer membrane protein assembly factor BamC n=1 Tax=Chitinimonas arctica TaxID=2594795 RepID=A0A516SJ28_9NEIS|nr:outer membrane protein assembly factor BamC [Chitinimonas arctica]QDQ28151.1 outer membrane protein assembly factor BamC [Chitinimonas arctica]
MIRSTRTAAAITLALLATGCSNTKFHVPFMGDDKPETPEYAQARDAIKNRPLELPPDLSAPAISTAYSIPGLTGVTLTESGKKALEDGVLMPKFDKVRMESTGGQRWLVVSAPAETIWPQARQFWLDQGFKLTTDSPATGILVTDWHEERPDLPVGGIRAALQRGLKTLYSTGMVDQYRMRIERGSDAGTTEIYISHRRMEENYVGQNREDTRWTVSPADPEREATQLKKLLVRLGVSADTAGQVVSTVTKQAIDHAAPASSTGASRASTVTMADGKRAIALEENFDRAWRRVGLALERAGFSIHDRDRSLGVYYVRPGVLQQSKDDSSFLSKLAFWKSEEKSTEASYKGPEYVVVVSGKDAKTTVRVSGKDGTALPDASANSLLDPLLVELR